MSVQISTRIIHDSFAAVINEIQPNANIYDNPNQQGTIYPAWFIVHRAPVEIRKEVGKRLNGNRYELTYQIDLWYMLQQNIVMLYDQYTQIAEALDAKLEYLPIFGSDSVVHVYDRSWSLELNALKYSTTLRLRVFTDTNFVFEPMEVIEDLYIFIKNANMVTMNFTNEEHPDFEVELPEPISAEIGDYIHLPIVYATHTVDDQTWIAYRWDKGNFNQTYQMMENVTADLRWKVAEVVTILFTNTDYPEFDIELPDPVILERGTGYLLPEMSGEYTKDGKTYEPSAWSVGDFGEEILVEDNTTANLLWIEVLPPGPDFPQGQFVSGDMNSNPARFVGEVTCLALGESVVGEMEQHGFVNSSYAFETGTVSPSELIETLNGVMQKTGVVSQ